METLGRISHFSIKMGWRYVLVNHTLKVIEETDLKNAWETMAFLIRERGWSMIDDVDMLYEENYWDEIGKYVKSGYKSHYDVWSFN